PTRSLSAIRDGVFDSLATNESVSQMVIVVDGLESESESAEATRLRDTYPQWTWAVRYTGSPSGIVGALNLGIESLSCPLTARQDDDDLSVPDRIDAQAKCFLEDDSLTILGSDIGYER